MHSARTVKEHGIRAILALGVNESEEVWHVFAHLTHTLTPILLKKPAVEPPSKFITLDIGVQLACRLLFIDMDGLNDGRAVKRIAAQINPRKMVT